MMEARTSSGEFVGIGVRAFGGELAICAGWHDFLFGFRWAEDCYALHFGPFVLAFFRSHGGSSGG